MFDSGNPRISTDVAREFIEARLREWGGIRARSFSSKKNKMERDARQL